MKFDLSETERQKIGEQTEKLFESFSVLENINTDGTEPLVTVIDTHNIMRDDVARKRITRDELFINAPQLNEGCFQIPRALDRN